MKTPSRRHPAAFTLIELMAVVTIIVILAGLVVGGMGYVNEKQAREKAKVQIALLSKAIEEYKLDMGKYPGNGTGNIGGSAGTGASAQLYIKLFYEGYEYSQNPGRADSTTDPKATRIYLTDLDPRNNKQGWVDPVTIPTPPTSTTIKDPWGNEYRYRRPPTVSGTTPTNTIQNPDFDLWSIGKDGTHNTGTLNHPDNRDDIRNF